MLGSSRLIVELDLNCELLIDNCSILYIYIGFLNTIALCVIVSILYIIDCLVLCQLILERSSEILVE